MSLKSQQFFRFYYRLPLPLSCRFHVSTFTSINAGVMCDLSLNQNTTQNSLISIAISYKL